MNPIEKVQQRPAESATPAVWTAVTGVAVAFGVDPVKAAAVAGLAAVLTPILVTYLHARRSHV
jgi:hypothetical protein